MLVVDVIRSCIDFANDGVSSDYYAERRVLTLKRINYCGEVVSLRRMFIADLFF